MATAAVRTPRCRGASAGMKAWGAIRRTKVKAISAQNVTRLPASCGSAIPVSGCAAWASFGSNSALHHSALPIALTTALRTPGGRAWEGSGDCAGPTPACFRTTRSSSRPEFSALSGGDVGPTIRTCAHGKASPPSVSAPLRGRSRRWKSRGTPGPRRPVPLTVQTLRSVFTPGNGSLQSGYPANTVGKAPEGDAGPFRTGDQRVPRRSSRRGARRDPA